MKKITLIGLLAFTTLSFTSCMKEYTCNCPANTKSVVKTVNKSEAKKACEEGTGGICTL